MNKTLNATWSSVQGLETGPEAVVPKLITSLKRQKRIFLILIIITVIGAIATYLLLPPKYNARASIMPPQQQSSSVSAMLSQLGGLAGAAGNIAGLKNPNDIYVGMLQSRTIADNLISRYKLQEYYKSRTIDDARIRLRKKTNIASGKDGIIFIDIEDRDAKFAAQLANAFFEELTVLTQKYAITEATQRRRFFENQLKLTKESLIAAEQSLRLSQEKTGMLQLNGQVQSIIGSIAQLKATIAAKEVAISAMRSFATSTNPEMMRANEELRGLQSQLDKLERGKPAWDNISNIAAKNIPQVAVEHVQRVRDVKYQETLFELLAKQFEIAKIDEAKDSASIQILDIAIAAEKENIVSRVIVTSAVFSAGIFLAVFAALLKDRKSSVLPN